MTVEELGQRISNREFQQWFIQEQLQPFGEKRDDLRAGILWALFATVYGKKGAAPVSALDYPLIKGAKTEYEEANDLHQKFLMFKKQYEVRTNHVRRGDKIGNA